MQFKKKPSPYTNIFSFFGATPFRSADVILDGGGGKKGEEEERKRGRDCRLERGRSEDYVQKTEEEEEHSISF